MSEIHYIYPRYKNVSFNLISEQHIKYLSKKIKIQRTDEEVLDNLMWLKPRNILLHPILYVTIGDKQYLFPERQKRLRSVLKIRKKIGGFETADSDRISKAAVDVINQFDLVFLPSSFAIKSFKDSGVTKPLEICPHGLNESFLKPDKNIVAPSVKHIQEIKDKHDAIMILFFCLHSEYRKGADLVFEAMEHVQGMHNNVFLLVKKTSSDCDATRKLRSLKTIELPAWFNEDEMRQLYDVSDMVIVPSRGGGFELNALEGLARGIPTLMPNGGCFSDYVQYGIPLPITGNPQVFLDNPIHVGKGWETNADQLAHMIHQTIVTLPAWKERAEANAPIIRQKYSWENICNTLYENLKKHGFCDGV